MGIRFDELTPCSPWQAPQLSAMNAPFCLFPDATSSSVAPVHATRVGVRNGGWGSPAGPVSAVIPIARQIAFQTSSGGPLCWYRLRTTKPKTKATPTSTAVDHQPMLAQGLSTQ